VASGDGRRCGTDDMTLTIVSVAFPFARVTRDPAGGSEQVLAAIDRALVASGHRSIVVAVAGSQVAGELRAIPAPTGAIDDEARAVAHAAVRATLADAVAQAAPDVVHLHGLDFDAYLPAAGPPVLATLHLPLDWYAPAAFRPQRPRTFLVPVSQDQSARAPVDVRLEPPIPNGVDLALYAPGPKQDYALVLGRVAPEKGFHDAIDAARLAGVPLVAAGEVFPYPDHLRYHREEVVPRLDATRRFVGPVHGARKRDLLAGARCVLIPSTAPETSSLVAMEALASGTPVIAYRSGALPSIVEDGRTGFLVDDVTTMAAAIRRIGTIDPLACRAAAEARFPLAGMTDAYLGLYRRLAA
jgi:glycosyltransferase involved in cell wall biosynthesis